MSCQWSDLRKTLKYSQSRDLEGIQWILWIYTDAAPGATWHIYLDVTCQYEHLRWVVNNKLVAYWWKFSLSRVFVLSCIVGFAGIFYSSIWMHWKSRMGPRSLLSQFEYTKRSLWLWYSCWCHGVSAAVGIFGSWCIFWQPEQCTTAKVHRHCWHSVFW